MPDKQPPKGGNFLTKKYGGLKGSYWLLGGAAVAGAGYVYYRRQTASAATATSGGTAADTTAVDPNTGIPYDQEQQYYGQGDVYGGYGGNAAGGNPGVTPNAPNVTTHTRIVNKTSHPTNLAWIRHAEKALEAEGYHKGAVRAALAQYLIGAPLSKHQEQMVASAIGHIGTPPAPPPRVHVAPATHHRGVHHPRKHRRSLPTTTRH